MNPQAALDAMTASTDLGPDPVTSFSRDFEFLANPYPCIIWFEDTVYPTAEHAFHGAKSLDWDERQRIAQIPRWQDAKRAGRALQLRPGWDQLRRAVMLQIQLCKYTQHPSLYGALVSTGDRLLLEGNWWGDTDWGAVVPGHSKFSPDLPWWHSGDKVWAGHNWLGTSLMMTRSVLTEVPVT